MLEGFCRFVLRLLAFDVLLQTFESGISFKGFGWMDSDMSLVFRSSTCFFSFHADKS